MTYYTFSIYDTKAQNYHVPYFLKNEAIAIRQFGDMVNDPDTTINKHPEDYTLFKLGSWDDQNSKFTQEKTPKALGTGVEFKLDII